MKKDIPFLMKTNQRAEALRWFALNRLLLFDLSSTASDLIYKTRSGVAGSTVEWILIANESFAAMSSSVTT